MAEVERGVGRLVEVDGGWWTEVDEGGEGGWKVDGRWTAAAARHLRELFLPRSLGLEPPLLVLRVVVVVALRRPRLRHVRELIH